MTKELEDKFKQLEQNFLQLEKSKDVAMKAMEQGKFSKDRVMEWHNVIYNIRILLVRVKRSPSLEKSGEEIEKIKNELQKGVLLAKNLLEKEVKKK